ncbi:hypothetical protein RM572_00595 [Streptomyces sp. DSM 42041]|uniref:Uncharacterized protein n=1 Tax=Streptomyces hazeniae TaxID=3075538 RepID=A0ABU2NJV3_9ACTN|nr:hypothetical protein [Streptomyces sp. DSM 42041]MDT0377274.1 hypothetical protein [Streptomyces sp. DSM 42041]
MGHRPHPDADRARRQLHRHALPDGPPPVEDYEPPAVRLAAASVTGPPTPGFFLALDEASEGAER